MSRSSSKVATGLPRSIAGTALPDGAGRTDSVCVSELEVVAPWLTTLILDTKLDGCSAYDSVPYLHS
jgi:hypothetical protein